MIWLVDFDDTLVVGVLTWALEHAFPAFISKHGLPLDGEVFDQAILTAQEQADQVLDPKRLLNEMFATLGWPNALVGELLQGLMASYRPRLFPDAPAFLESLQAADQAVYILSNNPRAPDVASALGLTGYVRQVFTPKLLPGNPRKPERDLLAQIVEQQPEIDPDQCVVVGDDPWSDGAFAENCGLPCWIIDRKRRFTHFYADKPYRWVASLLDIPITAA